MNFNPWLLIMVISDAINIRLSELLKEKGMSKYALCKKIGLPKTTLKSICSGKTKSLNLKTLLLISFGLDITVSEFLNSDLFLYQNLNVD